MARLRIDHLITSAVAAGMALAVHSGCAADGAEEAQQAEESRPDRAPGSAPSDAGPPEDLDSGRGGDGCVSVVTEFGLLCTSCPGDAEPECLVADCQPTTPHCLECTDPRGRAALDCSIDYGAFDGAGWGISSSDTFSSCYVSWGYPNGTTGTCRHPGPETCTYSEINDDMFCVDCLFEEGPGGGLCGFIGDSPVPDPLDGRPSILPPPGECITETDSSGAPLCSTCTREDLTARKSCRLPPAESCEPVAGDAALEICLSCSLVGGGTASICDDSGS